MVEDDTFTYHVKYQPRDQKNMDQIDTGVHSLITKERMQKLDLLIHLLSNLSQALIVCGPKGIGKTTLLNVLQERKTESLQYCLMQGNTDLSFEAILEQLTKALVSKSAQSLSMAFGQYQGQHKQVVLIVDNAGELVPGLITAIIQYAAANPVLRVVFALTHDELQVKRGSDRAVDDCHIVEIPTLSEKQCGDFLQHLSTKPYLNLSFKAIGENMISHIYRETHGVPGRIIAEISGLSSAKQSGKLKWILALAFAVAGAIVIVFGNQWLTSSAHRSAAPGIALPPDLTSREGGNAARLSGAVAVMQSSKNNVKEVIAPVSDEQKADNIEIAPPLPESQIMLTLPPAQPVIQAQEQSVPANDGYEVKDALEPSVEVNTGRDDHQFATSAAKPEAVSTIFIKQQPENKPADDAQQKKPEEVAAVTEERDIETSVPQQAEPGRIGSLPIATLPPSLATEGSLAQSSNNFTLQLMVLSKQSSVNGIFKKYPSMKPGFRVIKTLVNGQEKFILNYGSYPDAASANKTKQSLPSEFRNALVRKISPTKHR